MSKYSPALISKYTFLDPISTGKSSKRPLIPFVYGYLLRVTIRSRLFISAALAEYLWSAARHDATYAIQHDITDRLHIGS